MAWTLGPEAGLWGLVPLLWGVLWGKVPGVALGEVQLVEVKLEGAS